MNQLLRILVVCCLLYMLRGGLTLYLDSEVALRPFTFGFLSGSQSFCKSRREETPREALTFLQGLRYIAAFSFIFGAYGLATTWVCHRDSTHTRGLLQEKVMLVDNLTGPAATGGPTTKRQIDRSSLGDKMLAVLAIVNLLSLLALIGYGLFALVDGVVTTKNIGEKWAAWSPENRIAVQTAVRENRAWCACSLTHSLTLSLSQGSCCGLKDPSDNPATSDTCPAGAPSGGGLPGCSVFLDNRLMTARRAFSMHVFSMVAADVLSALVTSTLLLSPTV